jgi:putative thioredoxin
MSYEITDFQKDVIERSHQLPIVVDFWAEWCGPCRVLGPVLEKLAGESNGEWALAKVDTEVHREPAARYDIRSIPNVKLFVDGNVVAEFVGALPETMVRQWLSKSLPSKFEKIVALAETMLHEDKTDEARELLQNVLASEPKNHKAIVLLAGTYTQTDPQRVLDLLQPIEEDSEYYDRAEALRTSASLEMKRSRADALPDAPVKPTYLEAIEKLHAHDYEGALERFITVIREDRYYDDDGSRKACIAIFKTLGEEHELTQKYRRAFSSALYV